jgi:ribonucleoside-diphosphate reductase alpha chain
MVSGTGWRHRYARWLDSEQRRETWSETVGRYFDFMERHLQRTCGYTLTPQTRRVLEGAVLRLEVMPSMRALMTAGPALERDNVCAYNCSYLPVSSPRAFDECLYILMVCPPPPPPLTHYVTLLGHTTVVAPTRGVLKP